MSVRRRKFYPLRVKILVSFVIAILIAIPPLVGIVGSKAYAGTFTNAKVTISDSRAARTGVTYDFAFTTTATTSIKQIDIKFCTQTGAFSDTCTAPTGFTVASATRSTDNIAGTGRTDSQPSANQFRTVITTPASQATQAVTYSLTGVTNPSTTNSSFFPRIITYSDTGTTEIDEGTVAFATLTSTSIAVTAQVDSTFTFSVAGVSSGATVNGATTNITTAAATIPFGTLVSGTSNIGAHDVSVTTNSINGYTVTVKADATPPLTDSSNNIDPFTGTYASPTAWSAPAGVASNVNTGFFGYTTEDVDYSNFQSNNWAGTETTPRAIITSATAIGPSAQTTRIGWRAEVNTLQPPGSYSGTTILVATPTY